MTNSVQDDNFEDNNPVQDDVEDSEELTLEQLLKEGYQQDPFPHKVLQQLCNSEQHSKEITLSKYTKVNKQLHYREQIYILKHHPLRLCLCKEHHNTPIAGHPGKAKTYELLICNYY